MKKIVCQCDRRREEVRAKARLNGLDCLEVNDDCYDVKAQGCTLTVYFLGKAPEYLTKDNFRIEGGRRVRDIKVTHARAITHPDPEVDDLVKLTLDRYGDFSTYTLRLVNVEEPIDPYYDHLNFTFKINCPSDLDCKKANVCPPEVRQEPEINYLAKDYGSFRQLILDRLALIMPDWQERHVPDIGIALAEVLAYTGDYLSYYQDAVATEAYLDTARQRISVRRHARLVDYRMHEGCNARAWVCLQVDGNVTLDPADIFFAVGLAETLQTDKVVLARDELRDLPPDSFVAYEPLVADRSKRLEFYQDHNSISFYTWGLRQCCLPKGAVSATLLDGWAEAETNPAEGETSGAGEKEKIAASASSQDRARRLRLKPGDTLIFQEKLGPKTGDVADADPNHRHAVRLTKVEPGIDPLNETPILEIEWSTKDSLPFPLCLSALSDAEHGCIYADVSIARGNVVLADHGLSIDGSEDPSPGEVPVLITQAECLCADHPGDVSVIPGRYRPTLSKSPLTYSQPMDFDAPAASVLQQDPFGAVPQVGLTSRLPSDTNIPEMEWESRVDLLESSGRDPHFVVEVDGDGRAHLRFGDGDCGLLPAAGLKFSALYRVGNGKEGNVGLEAITHLVYGKEKPDGIEGICNPLAAQGGIDPEQISEVKLFAPWTFKKELRRAIIADDYASIAERDPGVQKAGAVLRWNGSWYEAQVAVDPVGSEQVSEELRREIDGELQPCRRMGHDVSVVAAEYVSLALEMEICVDPEFLRGHVKAALLDVFSNRTLSNGQLGFFHPDNLTFGSGIFVSRLIAAAMRVEGVEGARVTRLERQYEGPNHEIDDGVLPLGPLEIARCDNDPDYPEHGKFDLTMRGGR